MQLKHNKKVYAVCEEGAATEPVKSGLRNFLPEISCWTISLDSASQRGRPFEVDGDQFDTLIENSQCHTTWEIANILKIFKSVKLLVKMKNVSFILWKTHTDFLANLVVYSVV